MTLERKALIERSRDIQQRSRDLRKQSETIFADTTRFLGKARRLARIVNTHISRRKRNLNIRKKPLDDSEHRIKSQSTTLNPAEGRSTSSSQISCCLRSC
jgi:hypothetical protein